MGDNVITSVPVRNLNIALNSYLRNVTRIADQMHMTVCENNNIQHTSLNKNIESSELYKFPSNNFDDSSCVIKAKRDYFVRTAQGEVTPNKKSSKSKGKSDMMSPLKKFKLLRKEANKTHERNVELYKELVAHRKLLEHHRIKKPPVPRGKQSHKEGPLKTGNPCYKIQDV